MKAYLFPGQGSQFVEMGASMYKHKLAQNLFENANDILGFRITDIMFDGNAEELKATNIAQPAIFIHSYIASQQNKENFPDYVAGHSLGELTALAFAGVLSFESTLKLVHKRAIAMQQACKISEGVMAAIIGLDNLQIEKICTELKSEVVVAANYNTPSQLVISGTVIGVEKAISLLKEAGAKMTIKLPVGGAFHSPLMEPASKAFNQAVDETPFNCPLCPIVQNVAAKPIEDPEVLRANLKEQLTSPVLWSQSIKTLLMLGVTQFTECGGKGKILRPMVLALDKNVEVTQL
ncbi:ACP S-malonyltransferase [Aliikangiella sp. IMCC44359]|uniref:ACP S-malonyltransferase n=1 Tax=Aliikangiella sp. IMCC44359 TaxID=3459125 RepID=UPI00403A8B5A